VGKNERRITDRPKINEWEAVGSGVWGGGGGEMLPKVL